MFYLRSFCSFFFVGFVAFQTLALVVQETVAGVTLGQFADGQEEDKNASRQNECAD